jgi:hypothetical protein
MTKLEKLILVKKLMHADINSERKARKLKPMNFNQRIKLWNTWLLYGTIFISLIIYNVSAK